MDGDARSWSGVTVTAVQIGADGAFMNADLGVPEHALGLIVFVHGSGSSRKSSRNRFVAGALHEYHFATLMLDLLTPAEERIDEITREFRFDLPRLVRRVRTALDWVARDAALRALPLGLFGASSGAAAALIASVGRPEIRAVVSRGGRPDLAGPALGQIHAPTLLIVGGEDSIVLELNEQARAQMRQPVHLEVVPNAGHLFAEAGALESVARLAREFFTETLVSSENDASPHRE